MKSKEKTIINKIINEEFTNNNSELLFKQYKLFLEMADHINERRERTNKLYVTLFTSLFGGMLFLAKFIYPYIVFTIPLLILIITLSDNWIKHINDYKTLNKAKFKVINHLENFLPAKGYNQEWKLCELYNYTELTNNDRKLATSLKKWSKRIIIGIVILQIAFLAYPIFF